MRERNYQGRSLPYFYAHKLLAPGADTNYVEAIKDVVWYVPLSIGGTGLNGARGGSGDFKLSDRIGNSLFRMVNEVRGTINKGDSIWPFACRK